MLPKYRYFAANAEIITRSYRGPDRREPGRREEIVEVSRKIGYDANGNAVFDVQKTLPCRRADDEKPDHE